MSNNRLLNEYNEFIKKRPLGSFGGPIDMNKLDEWVVTIPGPVGSLYEGGKFKVKISFPPDYPNTVPKCQFETKVLHPNITFEKGLICVRFLKQNGWNDIDEKNIFTIILGLYSLLKEPIMNDPININARYLFEYSRDRYAKLVKSFTNKFAK